MEMKTIMIAGTQVAVNTPYYEGHVLTGAEARVLNQTRAENLRNNLAPAVKKAVEESKNIDEIQSIVSKYDGEYSFSLPGQSTRIVRDPVEREARAIAREAIKASLKEKGRTLAKAPEGMSDEDWEVKLEGEIDRISNLENVVKEAKKRVVAKEKATGIAGDIQL